MAKENNEGVPLLVRAPPVLAVALLLLSFFLTIPPVLSTGVDKQNLWISIGSSSFAFAASRGILVGAKRMSAAYAIAELVAFVMFCVALAIRFSAEW